MFTLLLYRTFSANPITYDPDTKLLTIDAAEEYTSDTIIDYRNDCTKAIITGSYNSIPRNLFKGAQALATVDIKASIQYIFASAFSNCPLLTSINMPDSVKSIGQSTFEGCTSLQTLTFPKSCRTVQSSLFKGCTALTTIDLSHVNELGRNSFEGCTNLQTVTCSKVLLSVKPNCFLNCAKLTEISGLENNEWFTFESNAFKGCTLLTTMKISRTQTEIPNNAFEGCSKLRVTLHDGIKRIAEFAFTNTGLTELEVPSELTELGGSSFKGCQELTRVDFSYAQKLATISSSAFSDCTKLSTVLFTNKIVTIGQESFKNCNIKELKLPSGLRYLNSRAFASNAGLTNVAFFGMNQQLGSNIFNGCTSLTKISFTGSLEPPYPTDIFAGITGLKEILFCDSLAPTAESDQLSQYSGIKVIVKPGFGSSTFFGVQVTAEGEASCQALYPMEPNDPAPKSPPPPSPEKTYCPVGGESVFSPDGCAQNNPTQNDDPGNNNPGNDNPGNNSTNNNNNNTNNNTNNSSGNGENPIVNPDKDATSSPSKPSDSDGKSNQAAIIAGSVVGTVAVVAIAAGVVFYFIKSKSTPVKIEGDIEP